MKSVFLRFMRHLVDFKPLVMFASIKAHILGAKVRHSLGSKVRQGAEDGHQNMRLLCEDVVGNTPGSANTVCRNNNINNNNNNSNSPWNSKNSAQENQIISGNFAGQNRYYQSGNCKSSSNGHHQQQMSGSAAASSLLANFLLLNPLNPDAKKIYFSMLPKIASESLINGSITIEDYKNVLNCFANNPQLSWEERRIIEGLTNEIDDSRRLCENKLRNNNGSWRTGSSSPLSPLLNGKSRRAMSLTGAEDVFSRMKTFKCDTDDPSSTATQAQKSSFSELNSGMKDVPSWLKSLRLHKYSPLFAQMTYDEMLKLTEEMLELKGVTVGARRKIILSIQKLKDRVTVLKQLEKELVDVSRVPATLSELRTMIGTPIKPQRVDQAEEENIPVFFAQTLVKVCSYLLSSPINSNGTLDDDCFSAAVHIIDKCLSHEAFMPPQKKRLASLKQEIRRLWSPRHYRRFSLQHNIQNSIINQNCNNSFGSCTTVIHKDRRISCDPVGIQHGNPCCSQAVPNAVFLSSLAQHLSPSTSNDAVAPLINLFCQHMNLQNNRQNVQRTSSAPLWGAGNLFSPNPQPQSLINGPPPTYQQNFAQTQKQQRMSQNCHSPPQSVHIQSKSKFPIISNPSTTTPPNGLTNNLTLNSTASMAGKTVPLPLDNAAGLYSPWSFYSGLQRSAWSCGIDDAVNNNSANSFFNQCSFSSKQPSNGNSNGGNGVANSATRNTFLSTLVGGPFLNAAAVAAAAANNHHHHPMSAVNIPSSAGSTNAGNQNNLVGSFGEYSGIDQLCRSMIEAIDCCKIPAIERRFNDN
uniref:Protein Smaug n=1 Tax=Romanomermis culicivorax TaxID=13658 RepID=A0A915LCV3_ROMCU